MPFPATGRLAIEVALHQSTDLSLGLGQRQDVRPRVQLALSVPSDHFVLPERYSLGIGLVHRWDQEIGFLQRIEHVNLAEIAGIERELDLGSWSCPPPQFAQFWAIVFQALQLDAVMKHNALSCHSEHNIQVA